MLTTVGKINYPLVKPNPEFKQRNSIQFKSLEGVDFNYFRTIKPFMKLLQTPPIHKQLFPAYSQV